MRFTKRFIPVYPRVESNVFFFKDANVWKATPLFLCLVCIEVADVMFAFDSVPAIIAITQVPFLVYTSNIFAILGLRSLFFLLAADKRILVHLEKAVIAILAYIGIKMLLMVFHIVHVPAMVSLGVVLGGLFIGVVASLLFPEKPSDAPEPETDTGS